MAPRCPSLRRLRVFRFLLLATIGIWYPAFLVKGADVEKKIAIGATTSDSPIVPAGCVSPLGLGVVPSASIKYHPTDRIGFQLETGYTSYSQETKSEGENASIDKTDFSLLAVSGSVLGNVLRYPHHNFFVQAGPTYFRSVAEDEDSKSSGNMFGFRGGIGAEIFLPYVPQLGISGELGLYFLTGSTEAESGDVDSPSATPKSDITQFGTRGGLAAIGLHYYFGRESPKRNR